MPKKVISNIDEVISNLDSDISQLNVSVSGLQSICQNLSSSINSAVNILNQSDNELNNKIGGLNEAIVKVNNDIQGLTGKLDSCWVAVSGLKTSCETCQTTLNVLSSSFPLIDSKIGGLDNKVRDLEVKSEVASTSLADLTSVVNNLKTDGPKNSKFPLNNVVFLTGTGDQAKDTQNLTKAIDYLNTLDRGTLVCEGEIWLTKKYSINKPISIIGGIFRKLLGGYLSYYPANLVKKEFNFKAQSEKECITDFDTTFSVGDYLLLRSNDDLPVSPHQPGWKAYPMEIHRVFESTKCLLENTIIDNFQTSCLGRVISTLDNFVIQSTFISDTPGDVVSLYQCSNVQILGTVLIGPIGIALQRMYNCLVDGMSISVSNTNDYYGLTVGTSTNVRITNSTFTGTRHCITTSAGEGIGSFRYGNVLNLVIENNTFNCPTYYNPNAISRVACDTHSEGYGIIVRNNLFTTGGDWVNNVCFKTRSRNTHVVGNTFKSGVGVLAYGPDCLVQGNIFEDCTYGVKQYLDNFVKHKLHVVDNVFRRSRYHDLMITSNGSDVTDNKFSSAFIVYQKGKDHELYNNKFNELMVQTTGSDTVEFKSIAGNLYKKMPANLETTWGSKNMKI